MVTKTMAERRGWDDWMWETLGDGRRLSIYHETTLDEGDLRHEKYDVDVKRWTRKTNFWTSWEAACISFCRDPEKVKQAIGEIVGFDDTYEDGKSKELQNDISNLCNLIEDAQRANYLTNDFFRPEVYVEWGRRTGVDLPGFIARELETAEAERVGWKTLGEPAQPAYDDLPLDGTHLPNKTARAQQTRLEANQTKIILALLLKAKLIKQDTIFLSKDLSKILKEKAVEESNDDLAKGTGHLTIEERLGEARAMIKNF